METVGTRWGLVLMVAEHDYFSNYGFINIDLR